MDKKPEKKSKRQGRNSQYQKIRTRALEIVKNEPTLTDYSVNQRLIGEGLTKQANYLYQPLAHRRLIRTDLAKVREAHEAKLAYEIVPEALKVHKKALKSKELDLKDKMPYVKLAEDKFFGDKERPYVPAQINLTEVQTIVNQVVNIDVVKEPQPDVIELKR